jgi:predicted metal-dependent hydrolase
VSTKQRSQPAWTDASFRARVHEWAARIGAHPVEIRLRPMRRKWASCSSSGRLTFDTSLLRCEREFGDFVIVHELLHLQVPNHGKLFKSLLSALIPGWQRFEGRHQQRVAQATILRSNDRAKR